MYKMISLVMILSFFLTSCCSVMRDPTRRVTVTAQQRDAEVFIDGYACGTAPLLADLDKAYDHTIVVSKVGYQSQRALLKSHQTSWSASNLLTPLAGAVIGTGIGFACYGATDIFPMFVIGTAIGAAVGLGIGIIGIVVDISSKSDCDLDAQSVHFNLIQPN